MSVERALKKFILFFKQFDFFLIFLPCLLAALGLISIFSSSQDDLLLFKKQLGFLALGIVLMFLVSFFDVRHLKEFPFLIYLFYFFSILLLLLAHFFGPQIRGTKTWLSFSFFSLDSSEVAKLGLLFFLAFYFSKKHIEMYNLKNILLSGFFAAIPAFLVFLQPNAGSAFLLVAVWFGILVMSSISLRHFFILCLIFALFFSFFWAKILKPYQKERILTFFFPQKADPLKAAWSKNQAQIAIGSGGLFGKGIKKGSQVQLGFLPEPKTDFIFAAVCEELGLLAGLLVILSLFFLILKIFLIGMKSPYNFSKIFCFGFGTLLFAESFIHLGMNLGIFPVVGISLPFVSYGGSNLISKFFLLGIVQNIQRSTKF